MFRFPLLGASEAVGRERLHHRATTLLRHFPMTAVSPAGIDAAREFLGSGSGRAAHLLETLPQEMFLPYVPGLLAQTGWSQKTWSWVRQSTSVFETMRGCVHACTFCYIDAPNSGSKGFMPWVHLLEVFEAVADERRRILREELVDVLINDLLRGKLRPPVSVIDAVLAVVRHARNRWSNYSDHLLCYWRSNPTNWSDPLFQRDYADICAAVVDAFQLFSLEELMRLIDSDASSQARFREEFGEDFSLLSFATSTHAVTSTVPFGKGSLGDQAISKILRTSPLGSELIRVSVPHPNLIRTGAVNPTRYWEAVQHSLRTALPKLVYIFATTLDEMLEVVQRIAETFETGGPPWWTEARLALYEITRGRERLEKGQTAEQRDLVIIDRLRRALRKLSFGSKLEGRGKQYAGNPFFSRGSVMCVNGVVLAPDRQVHYQACTTPDGEDLDEGLIIEDIQGLGEDEVVQLITSRPHTNRARELSTRGLHSIPMRERRKPWDWFATVTMENRRNSSYAEARAIAQQIAKRIIGAIRL